MNSEEEEEESGKKGTDHCLDLVVESLAAVAIAGGDDNTNTNNNNNNKDEIQSDNDYSNENNNNHEPLLWWSPLEPEELGTGGDSCSSENNNNNNINSRRLPPIPPEYLFTNEELAEALRNIESSEIEEEEEEDNNNKNRTSTTQDETQYNNNNNDDDKKEESAGSGGGGDFLTNTPFTWEINGNYYSAAHENNVDSLLLLHNNNNNNNYDPLLGDLNFRDTAHNDDDEDNHSDIDSQFFHDSSNDNDNDNNSDGQLLLALEDLDHIFDDDDEYVQQQQEAEHDEPPPPYPDIQSFTQQGYDDLESQRILEQLQGLSLSLPPPQLLQDSNDDDDSSTDIPPLQDIETTTGVKTTRQTTATTTPQSSVVWEEQTDIPAFLYCQPCNEAPPAASADIDFSDNFFSFSLEGAENDPNYLTDIDHLLAQLRFPEDDDDHNHHIGYDDHNNNNDVGNSIMNPPDEDERDTTMQPPPKPPVVSEAVLAAAQPFLNTFGVKTTEESGSKSPEPPPPSSAIFERKGERRCLGHRERILNVQFSPNGTFMATASADSTIRVWRSSTNELLSTLKHHDQKYECLRVAWASPLWLGDHSSSIISSEDPQQQDQHAILATGGADGFVFVLKKKSDGSEEWETMACLNHGKGMHHFNPSDPSDRPQIYALQFVENWQVVAGHDTDNRILLTSSEDHVHVWELVQMPEPDNTLCTVVEILQGDESREKQDEQEEPNRYPWHFREMFSIGFGNLHSMGYGVSVGRVTENANPRLPFTDTTMPSHSWEHHHEGAPPRAFGGERNPNGVIFVFDAGYCPTNGLLGVALSDGSLRLLNGRGVCVSVLQLPGASTHLTSFCWDSTGTQLATSVAGTGHVITWEILLNDTRTDVRKTSCRAVLGGGHDKTVFGARFVGGSVDKSGDDAPDTSGDPLLISWGSDGRVVLWDALVADAEVDFPLATLRNEPDYPVYGIDIHARSGYIGMVGGSGDGGFIGVPTLLYDVVPKSRRKIPNPRTDQDVASTSEDPKKPKLLLEEKDTEGDAASPSLKEDIKESKLPQEQTTKENSSRPIPNEDPKKPKLSDEKN